MKRLIGTRPMSTEDGVYIGTLRPGGLVLTFTCQVLDVDISRPPDHIGTDELPHQGGVIPGDPQTKKNGIVRGIPGTKRANDDRVEKGRPASGTQRLQNGLVFGDLISSGGHQRVVTVLKGHREIDNHGLATLLSQAAGLPWSPYSTLMWRLRLLSRGKLLLHGSAFMLRCGHLIHTPCRRNSAFGSSWTKLTKTFFT
ncbi:hypothetical protein TNCT_559411 [Trichonephila clavata]|uniref:Uncharacterized protein n=1 Tax=Trichonephila clavata TaxID=2740835 RepID=A0A8X6L8Q5_TRICU|nr:hypothetical protein TNCT_559411 [Trichonephila clavata]